VLLAWAAPPQEEGQEGQLRQEEEEAREVEARAARPREEVITPWRRGLLRQCGQRRGRSRARKRQPVDTARNDSSSIAV
jgi:hypothetical protein